MISLNMYYRYNNTIYSLFSLFSSSMYIYLKYLTVLPNTSKSVDVSNKTENKSYSEIVSVL